MFKSYTNQRNVKQRERSQQLTMELSVALPSNIKENIEHQIFEVIAATPFQRLSIPVTGYLRTVDPEGFNKKQGNPDRTTNIGFIKKYDEASKKFHVIIFERFAKIVSAFANASMEIIYVDNFNGLSRISKFNVIDLGAKKTKSADKAEKAAPKVDIDSVEEEAEELHCQDVKAIECEDVKQPAKTAEKAADNEPLSAPIADMMEDK